MLLCQLFISYFILNLVRIFHLLVQFKSTSPTNAWTVKEDFEVNLMARFAY